MLQKDLEYHSRAFENLIYNELIKKGYDVYVGKTKEGEIDFTATKNKSVRYIQAYLMKKLESGNLMFLKW